MSAVEPSLGNEMMIACWHCSLCLIRFTIEEGTHSLTCPRCSLVTKVTIYREGSAWRIKSGQT
jgi:phage FluMu protein Com